ncbi:MAG: site-specific integrase [Desulfuromonadales bacterium]|nr:site-specific integrase [Desulfuromonadales bacterium]
MAVIQERKGSDGKIKYRALVRLKGYPPQSATFDRKTDAKKWAQDTESDIRNNRHFTKAEAKKHTVSDLIDRYELQILSHKEKNTANQKTHFKWWRNKLGYYMLSDLTSAMVAKCRDDLLLEEISEGKTRGPATVARYMTSMSHAVNLAVREWEWMESNPFSRVKKPTEPRGRVRFLDDDERDRLLASCRASKSKFLYAIVVLAISTGMRQGEILNLKWKDIDLNRSWLVLHETKNNERRGVPIVGLSHRVLSELSKVRRIDSPLVFPGSDPQKPIKIRKAFESALTGAGIEDFRFHDLRHTAASYLAMNGATLAEIAEVLGHKTLQMVKRYAHLSESHTSSVVEKMNNKIFG